jgi:SNF family Na+-dependent transporter
MTLVICHHRPEVIHFLFIFSVTQKKDGPKNIYALPNLFILSVPGTFLLIYVLITLVFGIPLAFLEIVLGQFCQQGTTKLWRAVPLLKGKLRVLLKVDLRYMYPYCVLLNFLVYNQLLENR